MMPLNNEITRDKLRTSLEAALAKQPDHKELQYQCMGLPLLYGMLEYIDAFMADDGYSPEAVAQATAALAGMLITNVTLNIAVPDRRAVVTTHIGMLTGEYLSRYLAMEAGQITGEEAGLIANNIESRADG